MPVRLMIGDFSRMTYLSVKALRHYHQIGLLEPADVDPTTGYRLYLPSQLPTAQVIRRFRELGMPLPALAATGADRAGPDGALHSAELFQADHGEVVAFIPVDGDPRPAGRAHPFEMPQLAGEVFGVAAAVVALCTNAAPREVSSRHASLRTIWSRCRRC